MLGDVTESKMAKVLVQTQDFPSRMDRKPKEDAERLVCHKAQNVQGGDIASIDL